MDMNPPAPAPSFRRASMTRTANPFSRTLPAGLAALLALTGLAPRAAAGPETRERRYLYVVSPGVRNYLEFGGAGVLVFDIDNGHRFVKRIETPASQAKKPENIKGVCACAATKRLYFTTLTR